MRIQLGTDLLYLGLRFAYRFGRHPLPAAAFRPEKVKKLLIVSTTAVGDTVMSTSGLRALRHRYPEVFGLGAGIRQTGDRDLENPGGRRRVAADRRAERRLHGIGRSRLPH